MSITKNTEKNWYRAADTGVIIGKDGFTIAQATLNCDSAALGIKQQIETRNENANLIVSAVNACKAINPDNPQAVADAIGDMLEALKNVGKEVHITDSTFGYGIFIRMSDWKEYYEAVIAKAEGE